MAQETGIKLNAMMSKNVYVLKELVYLLPLQLL
jgi:hypothetical protein